MGRDERIGAPADYIRALYGPGDRVATVAIPREGAVGHGGEEPKVEQRVWPASTAAADNVQAWLRHLNARKYDIFLGMNPMRPAVCSRFKRDVLEVARVWVDIDENGPGALKRILRDAGKERIGTPRFAIETSPGRVQVVWQLERGALEPGRSEDLMRGLVAEYGGDRAAVDVSRVLRLPGFRNWKRDGHPVAVSWQSEAVASPEQFPEGLYRLPDIELRAQRAPGEAARRAADPGGRDTSRSGMDWRWARKAIRRGADPGEVALQLERDRQDKANPRYYARRTVRRVRESLGLDASRGR